ncbi:promotilin [Odocoileus virginianus]|uniref:Promotilin n=1 Tax=Odocoileus virginianus TaxID=9874 RepID=A0ABM4HBR6_ODOVR
MLSRKATAILLVVHAAAMLASQTEAFVPIFTYGEVQRMQEKERYKGQKKSLSVQQRSEEVDPAEPWEEKQEVIKLTAPVEIGMRMNSRQLEKYQATLEGLLREVLPSSRNEKSRFASFSVGIASASRAPGKRKGAVGSAGQPRWKLRAAAAAGLSRSLTRRPSLCFPAQQQNRKRHRRIREGLEGPQGRLKT